MVQTNSPAEPLSVSRRKDQRNALLASFLGWTLDAFDFFILVMVLTEIAKDFGCSNAAIALTLSVTLAFRPVGAFLFGLLADRYGRRRPLMLVVVFYSVFEIASGLAPNYSTFLILRALFGIGMGGEWGVGASLAMEAVPSRRRGILSGVLQEGYAIGNLLASLAYLFVFPHLGWRAMFFIGGAPAILAWFVRRKVKESEVWERTRRKDWNELWLAIRSHFSAYFLITAVVTLAYFACHPLTAWIGIRLPGFMSRVRIASVARRRSLRPRAPDHLHGRRNLACGQRTSQAFFLPGCADDDDEFRVARDAGYVPHFPEGTSRSLTRSDGDCNHGFQSRRYCGRRLLRALLRSFWAAARHYNSADLRNMRHPALGLFPDNRTADDGRVHDAVYGSGCVGRDSGTYNRAFTR